MDKVQSQIKPRSLQVIFRKTRERGLSWAMTRGWEIAYGRASRVLQDVNSIVRRTIGFWVWLFPGLLFLLRQAPPSEKRILAIWDFRSQPYSIGDLLILQEISLALCHRYGVSSVDVCLLAEPHEPSRPSFSALNVNSNNYMEFIVSLIPVILAGRHIAELHFFDSHVKLERYIADNTYRYHIWPSGLKYATRKDLNHLSFVFLTEFYKKYQFLPSLAFRPALIDWAKSFLGRHAVPNVPIVVQLRNAGEYNPFRNSKMDSWIELFRYCEERFPVRFIIICAKAEVDERLRYLSNVIVAKDFDTTIDQDLALIQCAAAYMGMSSGPSTVASFGSKPYSIINAYFDDLPANVVTKYSWGGSFAFANEHQRLLRGAETPELLKDEFFRLFSAIDVMSWQLLSPISAPSDNVPLRLR